MFGSDILLGIQNMVPAFPMVILTDVASDCKNDSFVDSDKIYYKRYFFDPTSNYAKDKVSALFRNIDNYLKRREELLLKLEPLQDLLKSNGTKPELIGEIAELELSLADYYPITDNKVEKALSTNEITEMVELIKEANALLE